VILGSASSKAPLLEKKEFKTQNNKYTDIFLSLFYFLAAFPSFPVARCKFHIFTVPSSEPEAAIISSG
jgi:hypothetical protein